MKNILLIVLTICTISMSAQNRILNFNNGDINLSTLVDDNLRTIECWFKLDTSIDPSLPIIQILIYRHASNGNGDFGLHFGQSTSTGEEGRLVFTRKVGNTSHSCVSNSDTWAPHEWHHVAGVIHPSQGMQLYIDGILQTSSNPTTQPTGTNTSSLHVGNYGDNTRYFDGQIDNLAFWSVAISPSQIEDHAAIQCYDYSPSTQVDLEGFYNFETDLTSNSIIHDLSPNHRNGNRIVSKAKFRSSTCFVLSDPAPDPSENHSAGLSSISKLNIGDIVGNGVRSIECWFKLNQAIDANLPQAKTLIYRNSARGDQDYGFFFGASNWTGRQGRLVFNRSGLSTLNYVVSNDNSWAANEWHHVVGVIDPIKGMSLYIDGVKQFSTNSSTFPVNSKTTATQIGAWGGVSNRYLDGSVDRIRFWTKALSETEINTNMCGFDPSVTQTGLKAHYDFEGTSSTWLFDKSGNNYHATNSTTVATQDLGQSCYKPVKPVTEAALYLDGIGAYGEVAGTPANGLRTIECWFKPVNNIDNSLNERQALIFRYHTNSSVNFGLYFGRASDPREAGRIVFERKYQGSYAIVSDSDTWAADVWHHVAGVIHPTLGMQLYIDGILQGDNNSSTFSSKNSPFHAYIGSWTSNLRYFHGKIDEVRFWSKALSQSEIQLNNCNNFDPTGQTGLKGYWNFENKAGTNAAFDLSNYSNSISLRNGATRVIDNPCGFSGPVVHGKDTISVCNGSPYQWIDGSYYYTDIDSGVYHTIIGGAATGNDSIVELNLTIGQSTTTIDVQTACGSYVWLDGVTYTTNNNTATHSIGGGAASGCDTTLTLNLTIGSNETAITTANACGSYTWIDGQTYTASNNTATHTVIGASTTGCDSTYTLNLTISNNEAVTETIATCNSYTWRDGVTYIASNNTATYNVGGVTANGCDSVYTLNLTISNDINVTETISACDSYTWRNGTQYSSSSNMATYTVSGATSTGCDSIYHLDLTINDNKTVTEIIITCGSYTWRNGTTYTVSNNTASDIVLGAAASGCDSTYLLDLTINQATTGTDVQTSCGSFTWIDGQIYTSSNNTATHTIIGGSISGCDSTVTLDLTFGNNITTTSVITTCTDYTWIDGVTYTTDNNTATHTVINATASGCDSVYTLDLTIGNDINVTETINACTFYTWRNGIEYLSSSNNATYTVSGATATGCDSIYHLNLTISNNKTETEVITACGSYTWRNGRTYTMDNNTASVIVFGATASGCDSTYVLDLTINQPTIGTDVQASCGSYTWIDGQIYTSSNNTATHTIIGGAATGCDSTVTLDLTFGNNVATTSTIASCDSYTWIDGITYTTDNNTATHTVINATASGCDSVYTLDLTINYDINVIETIRACDNYTWRNGTQYFNNTNAPSYTVSGATATGCDSIYYLNLTITDNKTLTDVITACASYTWRDGVTYTSSNNTASYTSYGSTTAGCDSIYTLDLSITTIDVTTTLSTNTISSNTRGASYRWLDCDDNNAVIIGETNASYSPTASGNYAVEISLNGCVETSSCVNFIITSLEYLDKVEFTIYPNPTTGKVTIESTGRIKTIEILSLTGQSEAVYYNTNSIDLSHLSSAVYFARILTENNNYIIQKIVKN